MFKVVLLLLPLLLLLLQARRWVKETVEGGKYKPRMVMAAAAAAV